MSKECKKLLQYYKDNEFEKLFSHPSGNYFLKLRSISRIELLKKFALQNEVDLSKTGKKDIFEYLFDENIDEVRLNEFISKVYHVVRETRRGNEDYLYDQLYKLKVFDWGGFYQNAVEQTIVNNYVKKIQDFEELNNRIDNDLTNKLRGYVLCSWYNHWSSILIEDMFRDHEDVIPSIGLIKKVDFFWHDQPFDLKVTYYPSEYMRLMRDQKGLKSEFQTLKKFAKENKITFGKDLSDDEIFDGLLTKISESPIEEAKAFIKTFHEVRKKIIEETLANPSGLIKWFYEAQGIRRFDSANRLFVVLVDMNNLEDSWKLKRNKELLEKNIKQYMDKNRRVDFKKNRIKFNWDGRKYKATAICLFIIKDRD